MKLKLVIFLYLISFSASIWTASTRNCWTNPQFRTIYVNLTPVRPQQPMPMRLEAISRQFLGAPYQLFVLGEGTRGRIDQCPLYRLDQFDCETYVTSVLALALSHSETEYKHRFKQLRYQQGQVSFITRNHFTSVDWNRQAQKLGLLKDVTRTIYSPQHEPIFKLSKTLINKAGWYAHLSPDRVRLFHTTPALLKLRLEEVKAAGKRILPIISELAYLPLDRLFSSTGEPISFVFDQIPNGAVIEIVRPNWDVKDKIGTHLDVSHLGFAFRHNGILWFRNASLTQQKVVDIPLVDYLKDAKKVPSIGGINIQVFVGEKRPQS